MNFLTSWVSISFGGELILSAMKRQVIYPIKYFLAFWFIMTYENIVIIRLMF